jgi:VCBS repeat-containing protein
MAPPADFNLNTEEQQRQLVQQVGNANTQSARKFKISLRSSGDPALTVAFLAFEDIRTPGASGALEGSTGFDILRAGAGDSVLLGGRGFDFLLGGSGSDTADYSYLDGIAGVGVDLARRFAESDTDGDGEADDIDILSSIEYVRGTTGDDELRGNSRDNRFETRGGSDTVDGRGGHDVLLLDGRAEDYGFSTSGGTLRITRGSDVITVTGIEEIEFSEGSEGGDVGDFEVGASAVAHDDTATTGEDGSVVVDAAANDAQVGEGAVQVQGIGTAAATGRGTLGALPVEGAYGRLSINPDGTLTYETDARADALDTGDVVFERFTYQVAGGDKAVVVIEVRGSNDAPTVGNVAVTTDEDTAVSGNVALTAADADDAVASLSFALVGEAPAGLTFNSDGTFAFDPTQVFDSLDTGETADVSFQYQAIDDDGDSSEPRTVSLTVRGVNDRPVVERLTISGDEDAVVSGRLRATDVENQTLTYALESLAVDYNGDGQVDTTIGAGGDLTGLGLSFDTATGEISLDPRLIREFQELQVGRSAVLKLQVSANDGQASSLPVEVEIQLAGRNDAPIAQSTSLGNNLIAAAAFADTATSWDTDSSGPGPGYDGDPALARVSSYTQRLESGATYLVSFDLVSAAEEYQEVDVYWRGERIAVINDRTAPGRYTFEVAAGDQESGNTLEFVSSGGSRPALFYSAGTSGTSGDAQGIGLAGVSLVRADLVHTSEDTPVHDQLAASDIEGDRLTYRLVGVTVGTETFSAANAIAAGIVLHDDGKLLFDPTAAAAGDIFQNLNVGDRMVVSVSYRASDGVEDSEVATVRFVVEGRNDAAVVTGDDAGVVTEAGDQDGDGATSIVATGDLQSSDVDNASDAFQARSDVVSELGFGRFSVSDSGQWTYRVDSANAAVNQLGVGDVLIDRFVVRTEDGTERVVEVEIQGSNDAPVVNPVRATYSQSILNTGGQPLTVDLLAGNAGDPGDDAYDPDAGDGIAFHSAELRVDLNLQAEEGADIPAGETTNFELDYEVLANAGLIQIDNTGKLQIDPLLYDTLKEVMAEGDTFNIQGTVRVQDDSGAPNSVSETEVDITIRGDGTLDVDDLDLAALADQGDAAEPLPAEPPPEEPVVEPLPDFTPPPDQV